MALWEYKIITSGAHGFANPSLLEKHLNTLGKDEWEIIHFQTQPDNPLAFHGLARRSTQRDWTPPETPAAAAGAPPKPAVSLFDAPSAPPAQPAVSQAPAQPPASLPSSAPSSADLPPPVPTPGNAPAGVAADKSAIRPVRDTERDLDPDAQDEDDSADNDWDNLEDMDDDLPTFFDALKPHFRRNPKGPGSSVSIEFLAKRWEQREADLVGALKECGLSIPETEEADPEYFEFEEDLYWVNRNNRGQLFINTREKPRPVFRVVQATPLSPDDPAAAELAAEREAEKAEIEKRKAERAARQAAAEAAAAARAEEAAKRRAAHEAAAKERGEADAAGETGPRPEPAPAGDDAPSAGAAEAGGPLPEGAALLAKIRPMMRRNRRGPGYSGSIGFLARALHEEEETLAAALAALGLHPPATAGEKPVFVEIGNGLYWLNKDNRGGIWINGREKKEQKPRLDAGETKANPEAAAEEKPGATENEAPALPDAPAAEEHAAGAGTPPPAAPRPESEAAAAPESPAEESGELQLQLETPAETAGGSSASSASSDNLALSAVRLLMKPNKRGSGVSGETGFLARALDKPEAEFMGTLIATGLVVPEDSGQKPIFVEHDGEIYWFSKYPKDGTIWLNAKPARSAAKKKSAARTRAKSN
ncbi:hypothetical protein OH491_14945 [Termitidicoccus mucosus]|uniref:DUF4177 domain-containing protein n=1 Tax=Termitidicoccus mucosus TaxID=1184151 RepID=A0A178ID22_9BACT|nr:hypothetical protein AW736_25650 [Opitutaceae bacterium TSB47]